MTFDVYCYGQSHILSYDLLDILNSEYYAVHIIYETLSSSSQLRRPYVGRTVEKHMLADGCTLTGMLTFIVHYRLF